MNLYLSRLQLLRDPSVEALSALLDPDDPGRRMDAQHRLLWSAFAGDPDAPRDFLWRAEGQGRFITLSRRPPVAGALFARPEIRDFAPDLRLGDRLAFVLRANATKDRASQRATRSVDPARRRQPHRRVDVVMDALFHVAPEERAGRRMDIAAQVGAEWLAGQGSRAGFALGEVTVADYSVVALPGHRGARKGQPQFGVMDLTGIIVVTDPTALIDRIASGFGRARAFGCGLMLIRRA